jgi:hypothetical protein
MKTDGCIDVESPVTVQRPDAAAASRRALTPYVEALRAWHTVQSQAADPDCALSLQVGDEPFEVGVWERSQLELFFAAGGEAPHAHENLIGYSLALVTKCAMDLERLAQPPEGGDRYELEAHLMIDQDLGRGFLVELDRWIEESVGSGQSRRAARLSPLRHRLARSVTEIRRALAPPESVATVVPPEPVCADAPPTGVDRAPSRREAFRRDPAVPHAARGDAERPRAPGLPRTAAAPRSRGRRARGILLGFVAAAWLASWIPGSLRPEVPVLSHAEIRASGPWLAAVSRHPSLFVTVDAAAWAGLSDAQRLERVELLSSMLRRRGFEGALLASTDGRPVAQWLRGRGVELLP